MKDYITFTLFFFYFLIILHNDTPGRVFPINNCFTIYYYAQELKNNVCFFKNIAYNNKKNAE